MRPERKKYLVHLGNKFVSRIFEGVIHSYISKNYDAIKKIACTIAKKSITDCEELCHLVILSILESDQNKINEIIKKKQLRYWIVRMMMNQYNSNTSPYHYTYRKPAERHRAATQDIKMWYDSDMEKKIKDEEKIDFINSTLSDMPYFDKTVTELYYEHNHSLRTMAQETGISRTTLFKTLKRTRNEIKKKAKQRTWRHD